MTASPEHQDPDGTLHFTARTTIEHIAERAVAMGLLDASLFQAAAAGRIAFAKIETSTATWPKQMVQRCRRPLVVTICDDPFPQGESIGPAGWTCAKRLKAWAPAVILHGAAGLTEHYKMALGLAALHGGCAIIETSSMHAMAWGDYLRCPTTVMILPPEGLSHPTVKVTPRGNLN